MISNTLLILTNILLLAIGVQDFKYRAVSWALFPLAFALLFLLRAHWGYSVEELSELLKVNLLFLAVNAILILGWFLLRRISLKQFFSEYLGVGDLLFFLVMTASFGLPFFPLLFVGSLLITLLAVLVWFRDTTVPLAGCQALVLLVAIDLHYSGTVNFDQLMIFGL